MPTLPSTGSIGVHGDYPIPYSPYAHTRIWNYPLVVNPDRYGWRIPFIKGFGPAEIEPGETLGAGAGGAPAGPPPQPFVNEVAGEDNRLDFQYADCTAVDGGYVVRARETRGSRGNVGYLTYFDPNFYRGDEIYATPAGGGILEVPFPNVMSRLQFFADRGDLQLGDVSLRLDLRYEADPKAFGSRDSPTFTRSPMARARVDVDILQDGQPVPGVNVKTGTRYVSAFVGTAASFGEFVARFDHDAVHVLAQASISAYVHPPGTAEKDPPSLPRWTPGPGYPFPVVFDA